MKKSNRKITNWKKPLLWSLGVGSAITIAAVVPAVVLTSQSSDKTPTSAQVANRQSSEALSPVQQVSAPDTLVTQLRGIKASATSYHQGVNWENNGITIDSPAVKEVRYLFGFYTTEEVAKLALESNPEYFFTFLPNDVTYLHSFRYLWAHIVANEGYEITNPFVDLTASSGVQNIITNAGLVPDFRGYHLENIQISGTYAEPVINEGEQPNLTGVQITYATLDDRWLTKDAYISYLKTLTDQGAQPAVKARLESTDVTKFYVPVESPVNLKTTLAPTPKIEIPVEPVTTKSYLLLNFVAAARVNRYCDVVPLKNYQPSEQGEEFYGHHFGRHPRSHAHVLTREVYVMAYLSVSYVTEQEFNLAKESNAAWTLNLSPIDKFWGGVKAVLMMNNAIESYDQAEGLFNYIKEAKPTSNDDVIRLIDEYKVTNTPASTTEISDVFGLDETSLKNKYFLLAGKYSVSFWR